MARYFFHTRDGGRDIDDLGVDLADDSAARREAVRFSGSLLSDDPDLLQDDQGLRIDVTDERDRLCCAIIILAVDASRPNSAKT